MPEPSLKRHRSQEVEKMANRIPTPMGGQYINSNSDVQQLIWKGPKVNTLTTNSTVTSTVTTVTNTNVTRDYFQDHIDNRNIKNQNHFSDDDDDDDIGNSCPVDSDTSPCTDDDELFMATREDKKQEQGNHNATLNNNNNISDVGLRMFLRIGAKGCGKNKCNTNKFNFMSTILSVLDDVEFYGANMIVRSSQNLNPSLIQNLSNDPSYIESKNLMHCKRLFRSKVYDPFVRYQSEISESLSNLDNNVVNRMIIDLYKMKASSSLYHFKTHPVTKQSVLRETLDELPNLKQKGSISSFLNLKESDIVYAMSALKVFDQTDVFSLIRPGYLEEKVWIPIVTEGSNSKPSSGNTNHVKSNQMNQNSLKEVSKSRSIKNPQRAILADWLCDVSRSYSSPSSSHRTFELAMILVDQYSCTLSYPGISCERYQLIGAVCLWIASKMFEVQPLELETLIYLADNQYSEEDFCMEEINVLQGIDFVILRYPLTTDYLGYWMGMMMYWGIEKCCNLDSNTSDSESDLSSTISTFYLRRLLELDGNYITIPHFDQSDFWYWSYCKSDLSMLSSQESSDSSDNGTMRTSSSFLPQLCNMLAEVFCLSADSLHYHPRRRAGAVLYIGMIKLLRDNIGNWQGVRSKKELERFDRIRQNSNNDSKSSDSLNVSNPAMLSPIEQYFLQTSNPELEYQKELVLLRNIWKQKIVDVTVNNTSEANISNLSAIVKKWERVFGKKLFMMVF